MRSRYCLQFSLLLAAIQSCYAQGVTTAVVPHATSGPQVHMGAGGRAHVTPNASENGVSYNGFQQFDVGKPGLSLRTRVSMPARLWPRCSRPHLRVFKAIWTWLAPAPI